MKLHLLLIALGFATMLPAKAATTPSSGSQPRVLAYSAPSDVQIADRRWFQGTDGKIRFLISSRGSLVVASGYENMNPIPMSALRIRNDATGEALSYEIVPNVDQDTGSQWSGGVDGSLTPGYPVYYDQDGNRNFGRFYNYRQYSTDISNSWIYWTSYLKVSFRACNGQYVCAEGGGTPGQALVVNRNGYGAWETFLMQPNNNWSDQTINHGEVFSLIASHPTYVYAEGGGGQAVYANRANAGWWEHFTIFKVNGTGPIQDGDQVGIMTGDQTHYWCAENGGGSILNANRLGIGAWETFTIVIQPQ